MIDCLGSSCEFARRWISLALADKSTLVQVTAWCHQATRHYLDCCWPRSQTQYSITGPQCVNTWTKWLTSCRQHFENNKNCVLVYISLKFINSGSVENTIDIIKFISCMQLSFSNKMLRKWTSKVQKVNCSNDGLPPSHYLKQWFISIAAYSYYIFWPGWIGSQKFGYAIQDILQNFVIIVSGSDLLYFGTKPLPESILPYHPIKLCETLFHFHKMSFGNLTCPPKKTHLICQISPILSWGNE